jgi:hypothetical protein
MVKKIIFLFVVLGLAGGGFFYWWQGQADVRELNKTLPEGIRVEKSLFGEEYKVVNNIDGYEFALPPEWGALQSIDYFAYTEQNTSGLILESNQGDFVRLDLYKLNSEKTELTPWLEKLNEESMNIYKNREEEILGDYRVIKASEGDLALAISYFFKVKSKIYEIRVTIPSENFAKEIILNGKW